MKSDGSIEYRVGEPMPGTKWVVRGKLGQGGMGLVLDVVKGEWIQGAMKVLLPPFAKVPEFAARFLDEVKVTATLQHANIVQVLDFDRLPDGTPFMVMERLRGRTLGAALRETRQRGKAWTPANTYAVAAQVCDGLYRGEAATPEVFLNAHGAAMTRSGFARVLARHRAAAAETHPSLDRKRVSRPPSHLCVQRPTGNRRSAKSRSLAWTREHSNHGTLPAA